MTKPRALSGMALAAVLCLAPKLEAQIYTRVNREGIIEATNVPDTRGFRLTYPGKGTLIHSRGFRGTYRGEFDHHILEAANAHGVSADLVRAVIQVESAYDHLAVSSKGARGLMQLMPATARRMGVSDSFDPRQNILGGARYLALLLDLFSGDVSLALAAYNAGENAVARYKGIPPYRETRDYVRKVRALFSGGPTQILAFAPRKRTSPTSGRVAVPPAHPGVYYKWTDLGGVLHVAQAPPGEGISYTMIRALR